jgi:polyisoprenoid-binding protein YceI
MKYLAPVLLLAATQLVAEAADYELRPAADNRLVLEVFKTGFMRGKKHTFHFERYRGTLSYDPARAEATRVRLVMEAGSLALKDTWLKPKDFQKVQEYALEDMLAATRYPELILESSAVRSTGTDQFEVQGKLTIRGVTKPVVIRVTRRAPLTFEGSATLKMTALGLKQPSAGLGTVGTKDEMVFSFTIVARST